MLTTKADALTTDIFPEPSPTNSSLLQRFHCIAVTSEPQCSTDSWMRRIFKDWLLSTKHTTPFVVENAKNFSSGETDTCVTEPSCKIEYWTHKNYVTYSNEQQKLLFLNNAFLL